MMMPPMFPPMMPGMMPEQPEPNREQVKPQAQLVKQRALRLVSKANSCFKFCYLVPNTSSRIIFFRLSVSVCVTLQNPLLPFMQR